MTVTALPSVASLVDELAPIPKRHWVAVRALLVTKLVGSTKFARPALDGPKKLVHRKDGLGPSHIQAQRAE